MVSRLNLKRQYLDMVDAALRLSISWVISVLACMSFAFMELISLSATTRSDRWNLLLILHTHITCVSASDCSDNGVGQPLFRWHRGVGWVAVFSLFILVGGMFFFKN
jgi:hypothetical protein